MSQPDTIFYRIRWNHRYMSEISGHLKEKYDSAYQAAARCETMNAMNPELEYNIQTVKRGGRNGPSFGGLLAGCVSKFLSAIIFFFVFYILFMFVYLLLLPSGDSHVVSAFLHSTATHNVWPVEMVRVAGIAIIGMILGFSFGFHMSDLFLNILYKIITVVRGGKK